MESELRDLEEMQKDKEQRAVANEAQKVAAAAAGSSSNSGEDKEVKKVMARYSVGKAFNHQRNNSQYDGVEAEVQQECDVVGPASCAPAQTEGIPFFY